MLILEEVFMGKFLKKPLIIGVTLLLFYFIGVLLFPFLFLGKVKSESELYGQYVADYKYAKENLTLHNDGSFTQEVTLKKSKKTESSTGKWKFNSTNSFLSLDDNLMIIMDGHGAFVPNFVEKEGGLSGRVSKRLGCIVFGSEEVVLYKKIE